MPRCRTVNKIIVKLSKHLMSLQALPCSLLLCFEVSSSGLFLFGAFHRQWCYERDCLLLSVYQHLKQAAGGTLSFFAPSNRSRIAELLKSWETPNEALRVVLTPQRFLQSISHLAEQKCYTIRIFAHFTACPECLVLHLK